VILISNFEISVMEHLYRNTTKLILSLKYVDNFLVKISAITIELDTMNEEIVIIDDYINEIEQYLKSITKLDRFKNETKPLEYFIHSVKKILLVQQVNIINYVNHANAELIPIIQPVSTLIDRFSKIKTSIENNQQDIVIPLLKINQILSDVSGSLIKIEIDAMIVESKLYFLIEINRQLRIVLDLIRNAHQIIKLIDNRLKKEIVIPNNSEEKMPNNSEEKTPNWAIIEYVWSYIPNIPYVSSTKIDTESSTKIDTESSTKIDTESNLDTNIKIKTTDNIEPLIDKLNNFEFPILDVFELLDRELKLLFSLNRLDNFSETKTQLKPILDLLELIIY